MAGLFNGLQLRQAQKLGLSLTPQLQQAIKLLQLSTLELRQEIREAVEQNPMLEIEEEGNENRFESLETIAEQESQGDRNDEFDPFDNDSSIKTADTAFPDADSQISICADGNVTHNESAGNNEPVSHSADTRHSVAIADADSVFEGETGYDLHDHLLWQLDLSPLTGPDRIIAENIIDGIDDSGYLQETVESITQTVQEDYPETTLEDTLSVLKLIQHYDPVAVGSRSVQECLRIQLEAMNTTATRELALNIVNNYLKELSVRDFRTLCSKLSIREESLKKSIDLIQSLNPRPGRCAVKEKSDFIIPDVVVVKDENGHYHAELNSDAIPKLHINEQYRMLANQAQNADDKKFFKSNLQEANWFMQSLNKRNETLMKVANVIVERQQDFMEYGEGSMHPMVLNDIASEIEMHESTVSRITTEKYIVTPKGTFELKYFFSSKVGTDDGGTASSTAIRARIKELIAKEDAKKPLSDSKLVTLLSDEGIIVARRTIAKYRESLGIAPSSQRKRLI